MSNVIKSVPEGACDTHIHFYGPFERYPLPAQTQYAVPEACPAEFFALQAAAGVSRAVVVNAAATSPDNRRTLDVLQEYPDSLRGIITVPHTLPSIAQLQQWDALGVRGVRYSYVGREVSGWDDVLISRMADMGWHLQIQVENAQILELREGIAQLPCDVVVDHMGRIPAASGVSSEPFQCLLKLLESGKAWVKLSAPMRISREDGPPYRDVQDTALALLQQNPDRALWGSDWPHVNHRGAIPEYSELVNLMCEWAPDKRTLQKVLVDNPVRLYGF